MRIVWCAFALFVLLAATTELSAQDVPKSPAPEKEHDWLRQFVGEWESESEGTAGPGQPAMKCKGTMTSRMLGGFWVVSDVKNELPGASMNAVQTIGYDTQKKKYVGTWIDSMMNHLWNYDGTVDPSGKVLTLEAEGPSFATPGKSAHYRDAYEFKTKDHIVVTSSMLTGEGKWITFMNGNLRRKK